MRVRGHKWFLCLVLLSNLVCIEVLMDVHDLFFIHWDMAQEWVLWGHLNLRGRHSLDLFLWEEWRCRQFVSYYIAFVNCRHVVGGFMTKIAFVTSISEWEIQVFASLASPVTVTLEGFLLFSLCCWGHHFGGVHARGDVARFWVARFVPVKVSAIGVEIGRYFKVLEFLWFFREKLHITFSEIAAARIWYLHR